MIDPTHHEESVMTGRMTTTLNANGDVCSVQKAGGEGVFQRVIMHCLQLAHVKAGDITTKIKNAVCFPSMMHKFLEIEFVLKSEPFC